MTIWPGSQETSPLWFGLGIKSWILKKWKKCWLLVGSLLRIGRRKKRKASNFCSKRRRWNCQTHSSITEESQSQKSSKILLVLIEDWTKNIAKYVCMSVNHYIIFIIVIKDIFKCIRRVSKKAVINLITDLILFIYLIHTMQLHNKNLRDFWIAY